MGLSTQVWCLHPTVPSDGCLLIWYLTDIKPSNVLVNYGNDETNRFTDIQLCDFESTVKDDSKHALDGAQIGTAMFRSPEAHLEMRWGTPTDIWSFGTMASSRTLPGDRDGN
jgi:serine/threonine protein kinase